MTAPLYKIACTTGLAGLMLTGVATAAEIKVGIVVPLTGQLASEGRDLENAIKLAFAQANANGDTFTTVTADDACDPQQAVTAASKLVSEGVVAVVGGYCSGAVLPTMQIYGDAKIPFVVPAANSTKLVEANPGNVFMINSTGAAQAESAVELFEKNGYQKVVIVDEGDAYSADLARLTAAAFREAGGEIVATDTVAAGEQDFSAVVTNIRSHGADAVFWTAYHSGAALLTRQLRQAGFQGGIVLGDGSNSPEYIEIAGSAGNGVYIFSPPMLEFLAGAVEFTESYRAAYDRDPGAYAALAFDGGSLVADAIARAGSTDYDAVIEALKSSKLEGLAGHIEFTDQNTLAGSNFATLVLEDGQWRLAE